MTDIRPAVNEDDWERARMLIEEFAAWHRASHQQDLELIQKYFDQKAFDYELASVSIKYGPPGGCLLLAYDDQLAGCVAMRRLTDEDCEMKRMFVRTQYQRRGIGRDLALAILEEAKSLGYNRMFLDTSIRQLPAQALYRSIGFVDTEPYYDMPDEVRNWLVFMERSL